MGECSCPMHSMCIRFKVLVSSLSLMPSDLSHLLLSSRFLLSVRLWPLSVRFADSLPIVGFQFSEFSKNSVDFLYRSSLWLLK